MYVYYTVKSMEAEGVEPSSATVDFAFKLHQHPLCPQGAPPVPKEKRAVWGSEAVRENLPIPWKNSLQKKKNFDMGRTLATVRLHIIRGYVVARILETLG